MCNTRKNSLCIQYVATNGQTSACNSKHFSIPTGLLLSNPACDKYLAGEVASYMRDVVNNSPSSYTFLHMDQMDCKCIANTLMSSYYKTGTKVNVLSDKSQFIECPHQHSSMRPAGRGAQSHSIWRLVIHCVRGWSLIWLVRQLIPESSGRARRADWPATRRG